MDAIAGGRLGLCFQLVHVRGSAWSRPKHPEMLKHEIFSRAFTWICHRCEKGGNGTGPAWNLKAGPWYEWMMSGKPPCLAGCPNGMVLEGEVCCEKFLICFACSWAFPKCHLLAATSIVLDISTKTPKPLN